ncbi:hypothetical protein BDZ94DRAFT_1264996 [Collybia nuda]|uniref:Uncharacterized protein n=1 Tax=Collybia nuda TaxID=64659 RepID=A0A9P5Y3M8_9AGAR|nr:hypothetical protein BDZ94DRAFT_1264996 [Collybia nuda]
MAMAMACCMPLRHFGGILDSPIVPKHEALACHAPLSPPPTLPTPTQALPPTDDAENDMLPSISEQDDYDEPFARSQIQGQGQGQGGDDDGVLRLLSPLSPDWVPNQIQISPDVPFADACVLLHGNHPHHQHPQQRHGIHSPPPGFEYSPPYSTRPALPLLDIPSTPYDSESSWDEPPSSLMDFDDDSALSTPLSPPQSPLLQKISLDTDPDPEDMFEDHYSGGKHPFIPYRSPPPVHHIHLLPELEDTSNRRSPSSPSLRSFSSLPELESDPDTEADADMDSDPDFAFLDPPTLSPPYSPSSALRSLPGADPDDDLLPLHLGSPGYIPSDADPVPLTPLSPSLNHSRSSLLLLDDPNDVPPPRSPSPENFHLDPALLEYCAGADPEVRRLYELRRRAQAAERAARAMETRYLEEGAVGMRWEARRVRRREKERGGEITSMLRLKLTEKGHLEEAGGFEKEKERKNGVRSMEHLVAKMLLRRGDTARSLADRKTPCYETRVLRSPLSRNCLRAHYSVEDDSESRRGRGTEVDMNMEVDPVVDDDDDEDTWPPVPWPMDPMVLDKDGYQIPG